MTDIVERLRDEGSYQASRLDAWELCREAADEIEHLQADNEILRRALADQIERTRDRAIEIEKLCRMYAEKHAP